MKGITRITTGIADLKGFLELPMEGKYGDLVPVVLVPIKVLYIQALANPSEQRLYVSSHVYVHGWDEPLKIPVAAAIIAQGLWGYAPVARITVAATKPGATQRVFINPYRVAGFCAPVKGYQSAGKTQKRNKKSTYIPRNELMLDDGKTILPMQTPREQLMKLFFDTEIAEMSAYTLRQLGVITPRDLLLKNGQHTNPEPDTDES